MSVHLASRRTTAAVLAVVLATMGFTGLSGSPAQAAIWDRNRHGIAQWAPQITWLRADEGIDGSGGDVWVTVGFRWDDVNHMRELSGTRRGMEVKVRTDKGYASTFAGASSNFGGYQDTSFGDSNCCTYGWGVVNAGVFKAGVNYEVKFHLRGSTGALEAGHPTQIDFQATSDAGVPGVSDAFRMFGDYQYTALRRSALSLRRNANTALVVGQNGMWSQSFEEGNAAFNRYKLLQTADNRSIYCDGRGYRSNCFLEFNRGSGTAASVYQDVSMTSRAGDNLTAETMVRCPVNQGSCPITLAVWGLDNGAESRSVSCTLPSNGAWYAMRLDGNHGFQKGFANAHSSFRWELYNQGPRQNVDVDYTTFANGFSVAVGGSNIHPLASPGNTCSQM